MPTAPAEAAHSREALTARLSTVLAEVSALAKQRDVWEAEARRIIMRLARLPEVQEPSPTPTAPSWIMLQVAVNRYGKSAGILRRHGEPAGWCWLQGGRWVCDPAGVETFLRSPRARARS